jgi:hypothetical protein
MQASSERTWQVRLALMLIIGVAAAAACVVALMLWKAPVASAQDEGNDPTGANFVVSCGFHHRAQVDPIVNPGPSGTNPDTGLPVTPSAHMHDFFGNTTTDSDSTYGTLRAGGTTCNKPEDKAAYWHPTVSWTPTRGKPKTLQASQTFFYYRAGLKTPADVQPFPALDTTDPPDGQLDDGLKVVTVQGHKVEWRCQGGTFSPTPPTQCGDNATLVVRTFFPDCLAVRKDANGQPIIDPTTGKQIPLLDTDPNDPNAIQHRSHMVDATSAKCPSDHPYPVPRLQTNFLFKDTILTKKGHVTLSSDHQGDPPGSTMHVDFFNAWDQAKLQDLVARCINPGPFSATKPKPADCG